MSVANGLRATKWRNITNSDTETIEGLDALYIATSGNLRIQDKQGSIATFPVVSGQILPCKPVRVFATGSTATCIGMA